MVSNTAAANQSGTVTLNGPSGTYIDVNTIKSLYYPNCILFNTVLNNIFAII